MAKLVICPEWQACPQREPAGSVGSGRMVHWGRRLFLSSASLAYGVESEAGSG